MVVFEFEIVKCELRILNRENFLFIEINDFLLQITLWFWTSFI